MRVFFLWFCFILLLHGGVLPAQELAKSHPKYQMVYRVYQRIAHATGGNQRPPELIIYPSGEPGNKWKGAGFEYTPAPTIFPEEKLIDLCGAFGARQADALAVVLGHELAHFYKEHRLNTSFAAPSSEDRIRMESEADYHGAFYESLACVNILQDNAYIAVGRINQLNQDDLPPKRKITTCIFNAWILYYRLSPRTPIALRWAGRILFPR